MKNLFCILCVVFLVGLLSFPARATLISVSGPYSSMGEQASIIAAPADINEDAAFNRAMQGFNEIQNYTLNDNLQVMGGFIASGTVVSSHMIFLNSGPGNTHTPLSHYGVEWTFDGNILGVMADAFGVHETTSSSFLGAPDTLYPTNSFRARGMEGNLRSFNPYGPWPQDGFIVNGDSIIVGMSVTEPGDWIRVVTASAAPVPEPATMILFGTGLAGVAGARLRRKKK